ncbi:DUF2304 domain-containing protein [Microbacterium sp. STN6]|uniref:DUF2304 domain-containing protein n=1 Tax=Microbacterium sp. STN6 TaxID=2995588 RepID=UPI002260B9DD|nr:DUF2304 domain-containing protein [Microbacterium sp. STN6]MCX7521033.1 DUF2304 domain-containing protein [Microbacterium sp. STN6]
MNATSYVFGIVAALFVLFVVVEMLRRRRLRERHAIWWLVAGLFALVIGVFPSILTWAADLIGITIPINLVFFVSLIILFLVCLQHSSELTKIESQNRALVEQHTLLELRVRTLEGEPEQGDTRQVPETPSGEVR